MDFTQLELAVSDAVINSVARSYATLNYQVQLIQLLNNVFPEQKFENYSKYELHKLLSTLLVKKYRGEEILKYKLYEAFIRRRGVVGAFEIKVNTSRIDFLAVNGHSYGFEIKSELDNFSKLEKQIKDYDFVFEYNSLIVDECHLEKCSDILPERWGIWSFHNGKYIKRRKAQLNMDLNPRVQLSLLTKSELSTHFPDDKGLIGRILNRHSATEINSEFKQVLKKRYRNRWNFLTSNSTSILPIDVQFFFNNNIDPGIIYTN